MGFQESPSFDDLGKGKTAKKRISQRALRRGLWLAIILLGTALLIFGGSSLGSRADTGVGGLDGCLVDGAGNPVVADIIYSGESRQSYADGCFFFAALPAGVGEVLVQRGAEQWTFAVEITAGQAFSLGNMVLK